MNNEYTVPEVIEIGKAEEVILGPKEGGPIDDMAPYDTSLDLDE